MEYIKFSGTNEKLFSREVVEKISPDLTLIVPETHNTLVIFDGEMLQTLSKGRYKLSEIVDTTKTDALVEIIFVSKTAKLKLLWGTANKFTLFDPVLKKPYCVGMSGEFEVQVSDPRKCFLYLVGAEEVLTADALQDRLMARLVSVVGDALSDFVQKNNLRLDQIFSSRQRIAEEALKKVSAVFKQDYGIMVFSLNISNIVFDENDLMEQKTCPNCQTKLSLDANFCYNCGKRQGGEVVCKNCQAKNLVGAKYCSNCGQKI